MRETFTSGSVGRAPGNRCLYPEADFPLSFSVDPFPDDLIVSILQRGGKPMVSFVKENLWDFVPALYQACKGVEYQP